MAVIGVMMTLLVVYFYQDLLAMSYDEEFAQIRGVPVKALYFGLIGMLAVTIVLVIQVVGLILVIALLTIPPFIVEKYARSLVANDGGIKYPGGRVYHYRPVAFVPVQSHIRRFDHHGFRYGLPDFFGGQDTRVPEKKRRRTGTDQGQPCAISAIMKNYCQERISMRHQPVARSGSRGNNDFPFPPGTSTKSWSGAARSIG
jgi:hypothetical protein